MDLIPGKGEGEKNVINAKHSMPGREGLNP